MKYFRFVKIEHSLFAFPLLLAGAFLASPGGVSLGLIGWILLAGTGARTAAFALNRIIDRKSDRENPRTENRELPSGKMTLTEAWGVCAVGTAAYLGAAAAIAPICLALSPIPLAIFVAYPYLKRVTAWAHLGVGLADAMAPLGGWMAVRQSFQGALPGLWLGLFTFFWVSGFDIIYAALDEEFDRRAGLHSLPARYGRNRALQISGWLHFFAFLTLGHLTAAYLAAPLAWPVWLVIGGLLWWEHRVASNVDLAFFKVNAVLSFGVLGLILCASF